MSSVRNGFAMEDGEISDGEVVAAAKAGKERGSDRVAAAGTNGSGGNGVVARSKEGAAMDVDSGRGGAERDGEAKGKAGKENEISPPPSPFRKERKPDEKRKKSKKKSKDKKKKRDKKGEKKEKRKASKRSRSPESTDRHEKSKKKHKGDRREDHAPTSRKKERRSRSESGDESSVSSPRAKQSDKSRKRDHGEERRGRRTPSPRRERSRDNHERRRSRERIRDRHGSKDRRSKDPRSSRSPVDRSRRRSRSQQGRNSRRKYGDTRDANSQRERRRDGRDRRGRRNSRSRSRERPRKTKEEIEEEEQKKIEEAKYQAEVAKQLNDLEEDIPFSDSDNEDGAIVEEKTAEQRAAERRAKREAIMAAAKAKRKEEPRFAGEPKAVPKAEVKESEMIHEEPEPEPAKEEQFDLFEDDVDKLKAQKNSTIKAIDLASFTDTDGYYTFRLGDLLNERYRVTKRQGKGVFSTVLRCADLKDNNKVIIIKVIRANETMYRAGQKELEFLKLMAQNDPDNKKHCVKLLSSFEHRNHLCMCFEPMNMNLRELLRKLGGIGLSIVAVQSFAKQLLVGLKHLRACKIVHADIKPDNILVNKDLNYVKICDLGSASSVKECEITPYLVSRFYRAPEIMVGLKYNEKIDIWSIGTVLYELYTGKILFVGNDNNEMLKMQFEISGVFPKRLIRSAQFKEKHFGDDLVFRFNKIDKFSKAELQIPMKFQEKKSLVRLLYKHSMKLNSEGRRKVNQLADLLEKMFAIDPKQRYDVDQCLKHPFVRDI